MRVFISSTVYDLIDVRAELAEQLRTLGITPVLSDDKLSDFQVQHDVNSIETCLINVDSCDEVVLILDKRYGSTLEKYGYEGFSATHLEYQRAVEKKKPVRVFVRDRLLGDYTIWKRNNRNDDFSFSWISKKDVGLFKFLDTYTDPDDTTSNWYDSFTSSVDLKAAITKHFEKRMLKKHLIQAIQNNNFPLIDVKFNTDERIESESESVFACSVNINNISKVPAFNFNICWNENKEFEKFLSAGQSLSMNFRRRINSFQEDIKCLVIEYESPIGILVRERFCIEGNFNIGFGQFVDKKYYPSPDISIEIEDIQP